LKVEFSASTVQKTCSTAMDLLIISTSLNPESRSRLLAKAALAHAVEKQLDAGYIDLQEHPLPLCDGGAAFASPALGEIVNRLRAARSIVLCGPVYAYGMSAAAKNLVELTGKHWTGKPVGLMAAAGGKFSYMALLTMANSLMLDYRCPIIPRYVFSDGSGFDTTAGCVLPDLTARIQELVETTARWGRVL
jgi:NAD(P)H-dependent FMN reductase